MKRLIAGLVLGAMAAMTMAAPAAQMPSYGATVTVAKNVDLAKFKTYSWTRGGPSAIKSVDAQIVAAVDKELAGLGMSKASAKPDVLVTYFSLKRTDTDLKAKPDSAGALPQYPVGTLLVAMLDPGTRKRVVQLRTDKPIDVDQAKLEAVINSAVAEMFAKYKATTSKQ
jgi:hypothetical protein